MTELLQELSVKEILEYYAIVSLLFSPVSVGIFIFLYKKTNLIKKLDRLIDKILGIKPEESDALAKKMKESVEKKYKPEDEGITCFCLPIGEIYHCMPSTLLRPDERVPYPLEWFCDNAFIGAISEQGLFKAKHNGIVNIYCRRNEDANDPGALAYRINVKGEKNDWKYEALYESVLKRESKENILAENIKDKIDREDLKLRTLEYVTRGNVKKLIYQFDSGERLERVSTILKPQGENNLKNFYEALDERMEEVKIKEKTSLRIWVRRSIEDGSYDVVDMYCLVREIKEKNLLVISFGAAWREFGEITEFLMNLWLAEQVFKDCIPEFIAEKPEMLTGKVEDYETRPARNEQPTDQEKPGPDETEEPEQEPEEMTPKGPVEPAEPDESADSGSETEEDNNVQPENEEDGQHEQDYQEVDYDQIQDYSEQ